MKSFRIFAASLLVAAGAALVAAPARAQMESAAPIVVKQKPPKKTWLKAEVIHADGHSIIFREQANSLKIHTFTYSPQLKEKMEKLEEQGGFQYGDKVKILYVQGQTVALAIHGKPSKPL